MAPPLHNKTVTQESGCHLNLLFKWFCSNTYTAGDTPAMKAFCGLISEATWNGTKLLNELS